MRIAINTYPLSTDHKNRGTGTYTASLIDALQLYEKEHTYLLFSNIWQPPPKTDIIHYPFFEPFFLTLPYLPFRKTVVTVHDLIPIVFPQHFPRGIRGDMKWQIQKRLLCGAGRIQTDSKSSKTDIMRFTGIPSEKIDVIYLAPSGHTMHHDKVISGADIHFPEKQKPYILYVGDVNWNKNVPGLIRAFHEVLRVYPSLHLILVGSAFLKDGLPEGRDIRKLIRTLHLESNIALPGYVQKEFLERLYTHAIAAVVPSFYEGFGLPVLEAFSHECPVVAADNSSLSEIAGPAVRCNADDTHSIAGAIMTILRLSSGERKTLVGRGLSWVIDFSWKRVARGIISSYEKILCGS